MVIIDYYTQNLSPSWSRYMLPGLEYLTKYQVSPLDIGEQRCSPVPRRMSPPDGANGAPLLDLPLRCLTVSLFGQRLGPPPTTVAGCFAVSLFRQRSGPPPITEVGISKGMR